MSAASTHATPLQPNALRRAWLWCVSRWWRLPVIALASVVTLPVVLSLWVSLQTGNQLYQQLDDVPRCDAALVLGTARYVSRGRKNQYFVNRIKSAVRLYKAGKVKKIIVSGDNRHPSYNEPREMYRALIARGVPDTDIVWDFAGFRTFDSVVRAYKVFGQKRLLIVSQAAHLKRALFIAEHHSMEAYGFTAQDPPNVSLWMHVREPLARVKAVADLYILDTQPKHLGEPISIFQQPD